MGKLIVYKIDRPSRKCIESFWQFLIDIQREREYYWVRLINPNNMSVENPSREEVLKADIGKLTSPERYKEASPEIADTQAAIDVITRVKLFIANDVGGIYAYGQLYDAIKHLEEDLKRKLSEGKNEVEPK